MTEDMHALAPLYVVGALEDAEAAEFEAHLAGCSSCRDEVAGLQLVTVGLSSLVAADPPSGLRTRVLDRVATLPQDPPGDRAWAPVTPIRRAGPPSTPSTPRRRWPLLVAAAALLVAGAAGGWAVRTATEGGDDGGQATETLRQLTSVISASDSQTATASSNGVTASVVRSASRGQAVLVLSGLPAAPEDKVYEAWTLDAAQHATRAGLFDSAATVTAVSLPPAAATSAVAVTLEPAGGSDQPTSDPLFAVGLR